MNKKPKSRIEQPTSLTIQHTRFEFKLDSQHKIISKQNKYSTEKKNRNSSKYIVALKKTEVTLGILRIDLVCNQFTFLKHLFNFRALATHIYVHIWCNNNPHKCTLYKCVIHYHQSIVICTLLFLSYYILTLLEGKMNFNRNKKTTTKFMKKNSNNNNKRNKFIPCVLCESRFWAQVNSRIKIYLWDCWTNEQ